MNDIAIKFEDVGKYYQLGSLGTGTLCKDIERWWAMNILKREDPFLKINQSNSIATRGDSEIVWALRNINLEVKKGDIVGVIGKNGAGKSTLLKLLSRITGPSEGNIYYNGIISSLLEVGTGFHPELTGRENIYMNGTIMGMKKSEIDSRLDEIIEFSGCARYIDTPVKRYSSGMVVRLGFAVASHLNPDILVVDEVLAVGDAEFQKKAIGKMQDIAKGGERTIIFVSHNMTSVRNMCNTGVLLENGMIKDVGEIGHVVDRYLLDDSSSGMNQNSFDLTFDTGFSRSGILRVGKVEIHSENEPNGVVFNTKRVIIKVEILNPNRITGYMELAGRIKTLQKFYLHYFSSKLKNKVYKVPPREHFFITLEYESLPLLPQSYYLGLVIIINSEMVYLKEEALKFEVVDNDFYGSGCLDNRGIVLLDQKWSDDIE